MKACFHYGCALRCVALRDADSTQRHATQRTAVMENDFILLENKWWWWWCAGRAYRECMIDGRWWTNPDNNTWSNYTHCINTELVQVRTGGYTANQDWKMARADVRHATKLSHFVAQLCCATKLPVWRRKLSNFWRVSDRNHLYSSAISRSVVELWLVNFLFVYMWIVVNNVNVLFLLRFLTFTWRLWYRDEAIN